MPVYLADSVVAPTLGETLLSGDELVLETAAGPFSLPACIDTDAELRAVCDLAAEGVELDWSPEQFLEPAAEACAAGARDQEILAAFYRACQERHREGLDGLWPHVLRNAFMPAFIGRFDLVVGNPPWVNWESLPLAYRERTRTLWERSGLFVHGGMAAMLGSGKKDVSMLMSYVVTERLLKEHGRLGFVITQTVFKTAGAGQGFRRFKVGELGPTMAVERVDDLVDLNPFVGATNRTALFTWRRDAPTTYPVPYVLWQRTKSGALHADLSLDDVHAVVRPLNLVAAPVRHDDPTSAWLTAPLAVVPGLRRLAEVEEPAYNAHAGVYSGANGVYWLDTSGSPSADGIATVTNRHDIGRTSVPKRHGRVESELVHPLLRGSDIHRWSAEPSTHILFVQDPRTRRGIDEETMRVHYPNALAYLEQFEQILRQRRGLRAVLDRGDAPYWSMFGVGQYTLAPYKVMWRDQAAEFVAAVVSPSEPLPFPNHKVIFIGTERADEAHYLCALLNSSAVRAFVASYAIETQISTHTARYVRLPAFEASNGRHRHLAAASRAAHEAVARGDDPDEEAVDVAAAGLWDLTATDVVELRRYLSRLLKRDLRES